jgi:regulator of nucleoside diphosphate kinase
VLDVTDHDIIITDRDRERLLPVLDQHDTPASELLQTELLRAVIVDAHDVPPDVVTMNSELVYEDVESGAKRVVRLVFPKDADAAAGRISVLAPIGAALLGLHVGQEIEWRVPAGVRRIRVAELRYQPEAAGHVSL